MVRNADNEISKISKRIDELTIQNNVALDSINNIKNVNIDLEREVGGFRFVAEAFNVPLNNVVKFFIFIIVFVFDPLAVALIIAFNGLIGDKKRKQREILTEMMENDQKLGLYEVYGDKKEDVVENKKESSDIISTNRAPVDTLIEAKEKYEEDLKKKQLIP